MRQDESILAAGFGDGPNERDPVFTKAELCVMHEALDHYCQEFAAGDNPDALGPCPKAAETAWQKLDDWIGLNVDPADTNPFEDECDDAR